MKKQNILIIGGTSTIAERCARVWSSQQPCHFILVGRDNNKLKRVSEDIQVRYPKTSVDIKIINFLKAEEIQHFVEEIMKDFIIDIALIAHGSLPVQNNFKSSIIEHQQSLEINGISPVLFAEAIIQNMLMNDYGKLGIIGSVAGDRGRSSNYLYGASKALIDTYTQGLQHRLTLINSDVKITLIKPGPTKTAMTKNLEKNLASPEKVAKDIVRAIHDNKTTLYTPKKWFIIMLIIKSLPKLLFNKFDI
ncbi:oxidoreductase [Psychrobacter sp. JCM 18902]|uniref:SDR family NAD(P)-dependent oxidoreductase n=1 Tax=Psychrobacter sp. JCM 18902 TaxID=1298607 RepID=UPI000431BBF5|nr:SDR family NAD(P)-dependent oxidoreductase [Psychrobacter sp. JCM 18902]GAF57659.1 oxidoreductase [Psychrobacter sp. JCM 18902]